MKIKTKLNIGIGMLFLVILFLAALSGWFFNRMRDDTAGILSYNYNSLGYAHNMLASLEDLPDDPTAFDRLVKNLEKQVKNVTEEGEQVTTDELFQHVQLLKENPADNQTITSIRRDLNSIVNTNMEAIARKEKETMERSDSAVNIIAVAGTLGFVVAFTLLLNMPAAIANPISKLSEGIAEVAKQNYTARIHSDRKDEFGILSNAFNSMVEKLQEYSEIKLDKLLRSKKRIEALIEQMHDPVFGLDEHQRVLFVNRQALRISGLEAQQIQGKKIQDIALSNDLIRSIFKDFSHKEGKLPAKDYETLKIFADDKQSYFEKEVIDIDIVPTGEQKLEFIGQVVLLKNVTPFKELDLAKTNFIGTVSHEFKTPIASIQMGLTLLENERVGKLNEEQKDLVQGIREDCDRLLNITGELLNMTQVESGAIQLNMHESEVQPIVEYAINANRSAAIQKNIEISVSIEPTIEFVYADNEKTAWVLTNFVSNAIRYSYENAVVKLEVSKANGMLCFSVTDTGQGIQPKYMDKIFERYFRIPGAKKGGTGLGLSISKEFIESQQGQIGVESDYGSGSKFYFLLKC